MAAARVLHRGASLTRTRLLFQAPRARLGWWRGGSEVQLSWDGHLFLLFPLTSFQFLGFGSVPGWRMTNPALPWISQLYGKLPLPSHSLHTDRIPPPPTLLYLGEVHGKSRCFRKGLAFSVLSYLGYEAYVLLSQSSMVHADDQSDILDQADYLYGSGETEKLCHLLEQHKNSENAQLLWRLARASHDLAQFSQTSPEKKKELTYEALDYAQKALEKEPSCFAVHKWYAICISDVGDYEGIKTKIANAFVIKEHFQKAIELNPKDATSLHLMGIWCFIFAEMPWYQKKIAAVLFATPPSSTYDEALQYFQKAEDIEPNFYSKNLLFLGKTYMKLNNRKMALLWLTKAKEWVAHTEEDKQVQKEAQELLNSL